MRSVTSRQSQLLHADVVDLLSQWTAPSVQQESTRLAFLDHLAAHPEGIWRECQAGHITASTIVINHDQTEVLLTLHKKLKAWLQLGGHLELTDTTLHDAANREAIEESGIDALIVDPEPTLLDWQAVPCHPGGSFHLDVQFAAFAPLGAAATRSDESDDLRWFPLSDLPIGTLPGVRALISQAVAR